MLVYQIELMETTNEPAETVVTALMNTLKATCDAVMPRKRNAKHKPPSTGGVPLYTSFGGIVSGLRGKGSDPEGIRTMTKALRLTKLSELSSRTA